MVKPVCFHFKVNSFKLNKKCNIFVLSSLIKKKHFSERFKNKKLSVLFKKPFSDSHFVHQMFHFFPLLFSV